MFIDVVVIYRPDGECDRYFIGQDLAGQKVKYIGSGTTQGYPIVTVGTSSGYFEVAGLPYTANYKANEQKE